MRFLSANGFARTLPFLFLALIIACGGSKTPGNREESSAPSTLPTLFPSDGLPAVTVVEGETGLYRGNELHELIADGADLHMEFGFVEAAVQKYNVAGGSTIIAKVHRMTDQQAAFGIFSVNRRLSHRPVSMGTIGARGDSRMLFCAGSYFVDIQATGRDSVTTGAMSGIATAIELQLEQESNEWPDVLSLLPRKGLIPHTEVYVEGPLGLKTRQNLSDSNLFELGDANPGAMGAYRMRESSNPADFLVVQYPDSTAAARVFGSLSEFYQGWADRESADSAQINLTDKRIVYTATNRMDVVILRTTQITALFDSPGAMHGTGVSNPHSGVKPGMPVMPHGMSNPHGGAMPAGSGSKKSNN
jgi:uncharacterized protein DUF6599